jgi:REP element-mobilizing transposase RayT
MEQQLVISESFNKNKQYERGSYHVGVSMYHFEWCTKYRYKAFRKWKYKKMMEACIRQVAFRHGIKFMELEVEPDHVHGTVILPMTMAPAKAKQLLKGGSAFIFFKNCSNMRKRYPRGNLWSRGSFVSSIGFIQVDQANEYVKNQSKHHETVWIMD